MGEFKIKKVLALILVLVMSLFYTAFADEDVMGEDVINPEVYEESIGSTGVNELQKKKLKFM